jgi:Luciferase-like monooxygenase
MTLRRSVGLTPMETRREIIVEAAVLADELGYESFAVPEGWGLDSTPLITEIALRTKRIQIASAVLSIWGRTPATLAMTAATLHQISGGRFALGLGASTRALAEGFHDTPFDHPAAKLRDVVTQVRALLAGEPAELHRVPGARALRLGQPAAPEVPIWIAALGRQTIRVAAELGDGWIPALMARDGVAPWADRLNRLRETLAPHRTALTVSRWPRSGRRGDARATSTRRCSRPASSAGSSAPTAMACASFPAPCPVGACGPRRGRPTRPPRTTGDAYIRRSSGRYWTVPVASPPARPPTSPRIPPSCSAG